MRKDEADDEFLTATKSGRSVRVATFPKLALVVALQVASSRSVVHEIVGTVWMVQQRQNPL